MAQLATLDVVDILDIFLVLLVVLIACTAILAETLVGTLSEKRNIIVGPWGQGLVAAQVQPSI